MTALWITLWLASLALVAWWKFRLGYARGFARGELRGAAEEHRAVLVIVNGVLSHLPTSRGARAIVKALGGVVPPLPRRKKEAP